MKRYETRTVEQQVYVGEVCDGCGATDPMGLFEVVISVNEGEEGGSRDEYDYCDDCLVAGAPALVAAGSRAPIVTGTDRVDLHRYLSTGCLHGDHDYCQTEARRYDGTTKIAATCKFCGAPCVCECHGEHEQ